MKTENQKEEKSSERLSAVVRSFAFAKELTYWLLNQGGLFKAALLLSVYLLWDAISDLTELIRMNNNNIELLFDLIKKLHDL